MFEVIVSGTNVTDGEVALVKGVVAMHLSMKEHQKRLIDEFVSAFNDKYATDYFRSDELSSPRVDVVGTVTEAAQQAFPHLKIRIEYQHPRAYLGGG